MSKSTLVYFLYGLWMIWTAAGGAGSAFGETRIFSGAGDGSTWHDEKNWVAVGTPSLADSVTIDLPSASVVALDNFAAQSITLGGKNDSSWTADAFVLGTIAPASEEIPAVLVRRGGTAIFKGAGTVTLKGSLVLSDESLPGEPSVVIMVD